jgi:ligand-binding sensor domain-containing protein
MSLEACMRAHGLQDSLKTGLQALAAHSTRVKARNGTRVVKSIDLDNALKSSHPNSPRWDYGISITRGPLAHVAWVEVHTATSKEVDSVIRKLRWLHEWLNSKKHECVSPSVSYHWVATDAGVHIDTARRRKLVGVGLKMPSAQIQL